MYSFNNIKSIKSLDDINNNIVNKGKDYVIVFFHMNGCGACNMTIPIICKIHQKISNNDNCIILKCHGPDITDKKLKEIYGGQGFPTVKILKKSNNNDYKLFNYNGTNKNIKFSTVGFVMNDYNKNDKDSNTILYYSTKNTLTKWIDYANKHPLNKLNIQKNSPKTNLYSANNIINNRTNKLMQYLKFIS
jgi:thiol-disulfide isomerase/thioredoxin